MLPGRRTFTDEEIISVVREALAIYEELNADDELPVELRPLVFQSCVNMVGQRTTVSLIK